LVEISNPAGGVIVIPAVKLEPETKNDCEVLAIFAHAEKAFSGKVGLPAICIVGPAQLVILQLTVLYEDVVQPEPVAVRLERIITVCPARPVVLIDEPEV
jgi:hypothetical protein